MAPENAIYTQGSNFGSLLDKGVDDRTGQYSCAIDVWGAPTEARNCPPLQLTMSFGSMNSSDLGLGKGWSFNLTYYDNRHKTLYLSTGEHFKVIETSWGVSVPDQKLKSFKFTKGQKEEYGRKITYYIDSKVPSLSVKSVVTRSPQEDHVLPGSLQVGTD